MTLHLRRRRDHFGQPYTEVVAAGQSDTLTQVGYQVVAATLAEPLRRAFRDHLDECGCAEQGGFGRCGEAMRLFRLLPAAEQVLIA